MPDAGVYHWTPEGTPTAMPFVQDEYTALYGVSVVGTNYVAWQDMGYRGNTSTEGASQKIILYASEAQAYCAYQSAVAAAAGNQAASRSIQVRYGIPADAVTTETVSAQHYSAWTESWTGPAIPVVSHGPQTDVEYMAQVGTALTFVGFVVPGLHQSIPDATAAQTILRVITQHLDVYATPSATPGGASP